MVNSPRSVPRDLASLPHVVVIGGGFAGVSLTKGLADKDVRVTIIDQHNFHTFQPLLYQVATAGLEPADVAFPIRTIFGHAKNVRFRHGRVRSIDRAKNLVTLGDGSQINYDHLVIATGAVAAFFGVSGASQFAMPLYTLSDARRLRNRLLSILEEAEVRGESDGRIAATHVRRGRGRTDGRRDVRRADRVDPDRDQARRPPTRPRTHARRVGRRGASAVDGVRQARRHLRRSVDSSRAVWRSSSDVRSSGSTSTSIQFEDGERIECAAVIWAAGVSAGDALPKDLHAASGPGGRVRVGADLRLLDNTNVWAVGDAAAVPLTKTTFCAQLAPVAIQSGRHCAKQILHVVHGEATTPFEYHDKGIMATIGRNAAVAELPHGVVVKGRLGWLAWLGLHLWYLVGFRNRLRVLINWTWRYFDWPSGPRLIVADAETVD